jgi:hypothetical protein
MLEIQQNSNFNQVRDKSKKSQFYCVICGKLISKPSLMIRMHYGGFVAVTEEEAEILNKSGRSNEDMGCWFIGKDCLKKHPELLVYIQKVPINVFVPIKM